MMAVKVSLATLRSAISKAETKADNARQSDRDQRILDSQIAAANQRIESAESGVTRAEMTKKEAQDKLSPPPTKQVTSDGKKGGTKTVVDEREKDKLQAQVRAADVQIQQAQGAVDDARAEAERLSSQALSGAGVSDEQQSAMGELSDLVAQLTELAEDDQTDLTSDSFQNLLEDAVTKSNDLADDLPDDANAVLNGFWQEIEDGFKLIDEKFTEQSAPDAYEIAGDQYLENYDQFFTDFNQGMSSIISQFQGLSTDDENYVDLRVIRRLTEAQNNVMAEQDKFLGGAQPNEAQMRGMMDLINTINVGLRPDNGINVDGQQVTDLINGSNSLAGVLNNGGNNFDLFMDTEFEAITSGASIINENLAEGTTKDNFGALLIKLNGISNPSRYEGFTASDYNDLSGIAERFENFATAYNNGTPPSETDIDTLINDADQMADRFITDYSANQGSSSGSSSSGSSSGGTSTGGTRHRRNSGTRSRLTGTSRR
ncbi:MAG: hypothetical protein OXU45_09060 [Candidatus Melainabacteria bacterium]|nr:hypothetical protein [Candidatus Melainabacteria bacterium]